MQQLAKLGAKIECVWMTNLAGPKSHLASMRHWRKVSTADYAKAIRAVGVEHFLLASDLGQYLNPIPTDGMKAFLLELREAGFSDKDIQLTGRWTSTAFKAYVKTARPKMAALAASIWNTLTESGVPL